MCRWGRGKNITKCDGDVDNYLKKQHPPPVSCTTSCSGPNQGGVSVRIQRRHVSATRDKERRGVLIFPTHAARV